MVRAPHRKNSAGIRLFIAGYYGFGNSGDEAILEALISGIRKRIENVQFLVLSGDPSGTEQRHGVSAVPHHSPEALMNAIDAADYVVMGGGGLFHDTWGVAPDLLFDSANSGMGLFASIALYSSWAGKPFSLCGVGIGPLVSEHGKAIMRMIGVLANDIAVRDDSSGKLLRSLGVPPEKVTVSSDLVFLANNAPDCSKAPPSSSDLESQKPVIAVAIRQWEVGVDQAHWQRQLALSLSRVLQATGGSVVFVPFQHMQSDRENDAVAAQQVSSQLAPGSTCRVMDSGDWQVQQSNLCGADLIVGMRYHSLLFAAKAGIPAVSLSYDPKVTALMRSLALPEYDIRLGEIDAARVTKAMLSALDETVVLRPKIRRRVESLAAGAERVMDRLCSLIRGSGAEGHTPDDAAAFALRNVRSLAVKGSRLESRIQVLERRAADLLESKEELEAQQSRLEAERATYEQTSSKYRKQAEARLSELGELESRVKHREQTLQALQQVSDARLSEIQELESSLQGRERAVEEIQKLSDARLTQIRDLETSLQNSKQTVEQIQQLAQARLSQVDELGAKLQASEQAGIESSEQAAVRLARINRLEAEVYQAESEARKWEGLSGEVEQAFHLTRRRLSVLMKAVRRQDEVVGSLRHRVSQQTAYLTELTEWAEGQSRWLSAELDAQYARAKSDTEKRFSFQTKRLATQGLKALQPLVPEVIRRLVRPVYLPLYQRAIEPQPIEAAERVHSRAMPVPPRDVDQPIPDFEVPPEAYEELAPPIPDATRLKRDAAREPLVSIVLPVWNGREYLAQSIRSALSQTHTNIELIVVDDGSDEDLRPVFERFLEDPRVRLVRRPHEGLPAALSAGFRAAIGDYLTWTSSDNTMAPDMIESLLQFLRRHPEADMVYGNMELIGSDDQPLADSDYRLPCQVPGDTSRLLLPTTTETLGLVPDNFIGACFLYRAGIRRIVGDYDEALLGTEDYDYWLRIGALGVIKHVGSDRPYYRYRVHQKTLSSRHNEKIARNAVQLIEYHRQRLQYFRQPFRIVLIRDWSDSLLALAADQLAHVFRNQGHEVAMFDGSADETEPLRSALSAAPAETKSVIVCLTAEPGKILDDVRGDDTVMLFRLPPRANKTLAPARRGAEWHLCESREQADRLPPTLAASWSRFIPSRIVLNEDQRLLCLKARDHKCPLWDLPDVKEPLILYVGRYQEELLDWDLVRALVHAHPQATFVFLSTDEDDRLDPNAVLEDAPNVRNLGAKSEDVWYQYLSRASLLLAPFADDDRFARDIQDSLLIYLTAGKPVLAAEGVACAGFGDAPNVRVTSNEQVRADFVQALAMEVDLPAADEYVRRRSVKHLANTVLAAANSRAFYRRTRRALTESAANCESRRPRCLVETKTLDAGGLEQVVVDFTEALRTRSFDVEILVTEKDGKLGDLCRHRGIRVELAETGEAVERVLGRFSPDIVVTHYSAAGCPAAWKAGIPILSFVHNAYIWSTADDDEQIRQTDSHVTRYVAVSQWVKRYFSQKYDVADRRIQVIPNGVDVDRFSGAELKTREVDRASLGISEDAVVLLNVGSLFGTKAQLHAISALKALARECPTLHLVIVSSDTDPNYEAVLREAAASSGIEARVKFCGRTSRIADYYRLADAVIMTSITEGWSLAKNEAMLFDLPMILTDVGGAEDAIRHYGGGVVVPAAYSNPVELTPQHLWELATNPEPENLSGLVDAVRDMYQRLDFWKDAARGGKDIVIDRFSAASIGDLYAQTVQETLWQHYGHGEFRSAEGRVPGPVEPPLTGLGGRLQATHNRPR